MYIRMAENGSPQVEAWTAALELIGNLRRCFKTFLGAAAGSPYVVFISTSGILCSFDIYIYIYIIRIIATMNLCYNLYYAKKRWLISNVDNKKLGLNSCVEASLNVITSAKVLLKIRKTPK